MKLRSYTRKLKDISIVRVMGLFLMIAIFVVLPFQIIPVGAETKEYYVDDYGAIADGITDSTSAIQAAVNAAKASGSPSVINFNEGTYLVDKVIVSKNSTADFAVFMEGMSDCTMVGNKTTILINNPSLGGFRILDSDHITIKGLTFDYTNLSYAQGTLSQVNALTGELTLDIDEGYPDFNAACFSDPNVFEGTWGGLVVKENDKKMSQFGPYALVGADFTHVNGRRWIIKVAEQSKIIITRAGLKPGDRYVQMSKRSINAIVNAWGSKNITITENTIYASCSVCLMVGLCEEVTISKNTIEIKPGSDRLISSIGGGIHSLGVRGGQEISNNSFYGMMDDSMNFHSRAGFIRSVLSSNKVTVNNAGTNDYRVGDVVHIYDCHTNLNKAVVKITKVTTLTTYVQELEFDQPVSGIKASFDRDDSDRIFNTATCGQNTLVKDNTFISHRARSVLIRGYGAIIENNLFNLSAANFDAISLEYSDAYYEGPAPYNIIIRNNTFIGTHTAVNTSAIAAYAGTETGEHHSRIIQNVLIENNTMSSLQYTAIQFTGVDQAMIRNNRIDVSLDRLPGSTILLKNSRGIIIDGLTGIDPNTSAKTSSVIKIEASCVTGFAGFKLLNMDYSLTATAFQPLLVSNMSTKSNIPNTMLSGYLLKYWDDPVSDPNSSQEESQFTSSVVSTPISEELSSSALSFSSSAFSSASSLESQSTQGSITGSSEESSKKISELNEDESGNQITGHMNSESGTESSETDPDQRNTVIPIFIALGILITGIGAGLIIKLKYRNRDITN
jgi:hypothetical protein